MVDQIETLLSLETSEDRRIWLAQHFPTSNKALVEALREEAYRRERDNPHTSLRVARSIADAAAVWDDPQTRAAGLHVEANVRHLLGEHTLALELYQKASSLYRSLNLEMEAARVAVGQFATMKDVGLYDEALATAEWAGNVLRNAGDRLALGKIMLNRGNLFARLDRYSEARASYAEARSLFTALDSRRYLAMVDANDANVLSLLDDFQQAEQMYRRARGYFEAKDMASVTAQIDDNLAYLYFAQGHYQAALKTFNQARQTFALHEDAIKVAYVDFHRSDICLALNLWDEALDTARAARSAFESADMMWETARLWLNEAAALAHIDNLSPDHALNRARQIFTQEQNTVWLAVTDLYQASVERRRGNLVAARDNAHRAREIFQQLELSSRVAQCEIILGEVALLENNLQAASQYFTQGTARLKEADLPAVSYACHFGLGRTAQQQGQLMRAKQHYRRAVSDIERLQTAIGAEDYKMAFLSDKLQVYEDLIFLCLNLNTPEAEREAFETVERAKSRTLLDALARETPPPNDSPAETNLLAELERLKRELNWHYNRLYRPRSGDEQLPAAQISQLTDAIFRREQALKQLLNQLRSPDMAAIPRNPIWTVTPKQIQTILPAGTMLLEFYTAHEEIIVFGLSQETMWSQRLPVSSSEISDILGQLRFQINKFSYGPVYRQRHAVALQQGVDDPLRHLYHLLILPIAEQLTAKTLIIVPHGLLHYLPFHAMFDGRSYLIEEKIISYAPSATILHQVLSNKKEAAPEPPLIIGLPDDFIPHVQAEAEAVASLFPTAQICIGQQATIGSLAANNKRPAFLHLSTHATFRDDNPLFSALKLADGWMDVNDIYEMTDSAPLITLSACETGRNQVAVGDELVGLCRGFFSAGAQSLIVSLWTVDDSSTARLMTHFYRELQAGQPVNRALRSAQMAIKSELQHPYYWAPFVLTGSAGTRLSAIRPNN